MKFRYFPLACALLFATAITAISAEPKLPKNLIRSFDMRSPSKKLQEKPPDYYYAEVTRVSPDGKYVARLVAGMGEYTYLTIYRRVGKKNVWNKRYAVSKTFAVTSSYIWVPHHYSHRLVLTQVGEGLGSIVLWDGPNKTRFLKRAKSGDEGYDAYGTSPDGRVLYYEHFGPGTSDPKYRRDTVQTLILPK